MKKIKRKQRRNIFIGIFFILVLIFFAYRYYHDNTFVEKNMKEYTGIKKYIIIANYHDQYQSFIEVYISIHDKNKLLKKYKFVNSLEGIKGEITPEFINERDDFAYYIIKRGPRSYRYIIIALEKDGFKLQVYEFYG